MNKNNPYCQVLGIQVPRLEQAARSPDANFFSLLIAALLERGEPISLAQAAARFEEAGIAPADSALASLKRCKPARPPIYRDGDLYALDPHDSELDLWVFRLGLRGPRVVIPPAAPPEPRPLPPIDRPLPLADLEEAWREGIPGQWSAQRIAICVLDVHGRAMEPDEVLAFVRSRTPASSLYGEAAQYWRKGAPIHVRDDGKWELDRSHPAVVSARRAVGETIGIVRRRNGRRRDPEVEKAIREQFKRQRRANAEALARLKRVLIHAFPAEDPEVLVLLDVNSRRITTLAGNEVAGAGEILESYEVIGALNVRPLLRRLGFDPGIRRLVELIPHQKSLRLGGRGRTLKVTLDLLIRSSCGISRPLGDAETLRGYLLRGDIAKLRERLEMDARSLFALYAYGRLHGAVRLRWRNLDELLPVPWVYRDERMLWYLLDQALERGVPLEVVLDRAPDWSEPWSQARLAQVIRHPNGWSRLLVGQDGYVIDRADVQKARLIEPSAASPGIRPRARLHHN